MRVLITLPLAVAFASPFLLAAQEAAPRPAPDTTTVSSLMSCSRAGCLQRGSVVRVSSSVPLLRRHESSVSRFTRDTLYLDQASLASTGGQGTAVAVPITGLSRLDISAGRSGRGASTTGGAIVGFLVGGVVLGAIGYYGTGGGGGHRGADNLAGIGVIIGAPVGAIAGGIVGGALGWQQGGRRKWQRVRLPLALP